jgi:hypothetical protein
VNASAIEIDRVYAGADEMVSACHVRALISFFEDDDPELASSQMKHLCQEEAHARVKIANAGR